MVNYANKELPKVLSWSAIDIGRLLVPLKIIYQKFPVHRPSINKALARWQTQNMLDRGLIWSIIKSRWNSTFITSKKGV